MPGLGAEEVVDVVAVRAAAILAAAWTAEPARAAQVVIRAVPAALAPAGPGDPAWNAAVPARVPLTAQMLVSPRGGSSGFVEVRAIATPDAIVFRLGWPDGTKNDRWDISNRFADGCAVMVPGRAGAMPFPLMGHRTEPCTILRWRALDPNAEPYPKAYADFHRPDALETTNPARAGQAEHLVAHGYGTLDWKPVQDARTAGAWADGRWTVILSAPRASFLPAPLRKGEAKPAGVPPPPGLIPVSFAVWNGEKGERDGIKSVSVWQWLSLDGAALPAESDPVARGRMVFSRYGCEACHGPGGKGGVANPNSQGGVVPPIDKVAEGFTDEELAQVITKGRVSVPVDDRAPPPPLRMNAWGTVMDQGELGDLVAYLKTLLPKPAAGEGW